MPLSVGIKAPIVADHDAFLGLEWYRLWLVLGPPERQRFVRGEPQIGETCGHRGPTSRPYGIVVALLIFSNHVMPPLVAPNLVHVGPT